MSHSGRGTLVVMGLAVLAALAMHGVARHERPGVGQEDQAVPCALYAAFPTEDKLGGEVSILSSWQGPDLESFRTVLEPFRRGAGVAISLESAADLASVLQARVEEGSPPDVAVLPGPALLREYALRECLVPLRRVVSLDDLARRAPRGWLELASVEGQPYALLYRGINKSIVWYSPAQFQGHRWTVPVTWNDLVALGDRIARLGLAPWALALEGRADSGEAGTDWIENILLREAGPQVYDRWIRHEIPWTDPAVRQAFLQWGKIVGRPRHLCGGALAALRTSVGQAIGDLYQELPAAYLHLGGSTTEPLIARDFPHQVAGRDYDFFALPPLALQEEAPVLAGADLIVMFNDSPQAEALVRYLASAEAQAIGARRGGFVALDREPDLRVYVDPLSRRAARQLLEAEVWRYDGSQQMPPVVGRAFQAAVREFLVSPGRLGAILAELEEIARVAYAAASAGTGTARGEAVSMVEAPPVWLAPPGDPAWLKAQVSWPGRGPAVGAPEGAPLRDLGGQTKATDAMCVP